jgi:hypothetical protein
MKRDGDISLVDHRACFDAYAGDKTELTTQCEREAHPARLLESLDVSARTREK